MKDDRYAKYLENIVSNKDLIAFICEDSTDVKAFMHQMHQMKLTVNIFHIVPEHSSTFQPQHPIDRYKFVEIFGIVSCHGELVGLFSRQLLV